MHMDMLTTTTTSDPFPVIHVIIQLPAGVDACGGAWCAPTHLWLCDRGRWDAGGGAVHAKPLGRWDNCSLQTQAMARLHAAVMWVACFSHVDPHALAHRVDQHTHDDSSGHAASKNRHDKAAQPIRP